jgi:DNA-binding SARP family transcriptional activator
MLVLELFGTLALRRDDGVVPAAARQKRRMGLLAILAVAGRQGMSRNRVEAYLWPESDAARARHALDQTIYAIRRTLGNDVVIATGQTLSVNSEVVVADVWAFDDAIRACNWTSAVECYRGALLEGAHLGASQALDSWMDGERARRLHQYQAAIESLAERSAGVGDVSQHLALRRKLAESDPLSAAATQKLIAALAGAGDRAGAVKHGRVYQELVRRELDIEPDAAIEKLISDLTQTSPTELPNDSGAAEQPSDATIATEALMVLPAHRWLPNVRRRRIAAMTSAATALLAFGAFAVETHARSQPTARDAYLRGLSAWEDRTKEGNERAIVYFRQATALDPGYAEAFAGLAEAYVRLGYFGYRPAVAMFPKAKGAALRSIELDSTRAAPRTALATAMIWEHHFAGAEAQYRKAIALEPTNATAHQWYGVLLMIMGRTREAVEEERQASTLAPLSLQIQNNYATFLNVSGDRAAALRQFRNIAGEEPDSAWVSRNPWLLANMARAYADNGDYAVALRLIKQAVAILPRVPRALHTLAVIYDEMGRPDLAREAYARADTANEQYAAYRGMLYADQGSPDSAFQWFSGAEKWGIQPMLALQADSRLKRFRNDLRYAELLRRLGIEPP